MQSELQMYLNDRLVRAVHKLRNTIREKGWGFENLSNDFAL